MVKHAVAFVCAAVVLCLLAGQGLAAGAGLPENIGKTVEERIRPVMEEYGIPGMAVGVTAGGESRVFLFGVASKKDDRKVTADTLFEIGSVSKTFTGLLTAYAEQQRLLSLEDKASRHWPALKGSSFDAISIIELGTYTAGGLPLQFPDSVGNDEQMLAYFTKWRPEYSPGSKRLYSNPSLGLMGRLTALSMGSPFAEIMEKSIFPKLGLKSTYIQVPANRMADYAWGYSKDDKPVRVTPGVLDAETYGIKTTAGDLLRYVELAMNPEGLDAPLQKAFSATFAGYFQVAGMIQGLGWEMYPQPAKLEDLLAGNSAEVIFKPNEARRISPPLPPQTAALCNKTGSTNGFGAYAAFIPAEGMGVVLLANKSYPIPARVRIAHSLFEALRGTAE